MSNWNVLHLSTGHSGGAGLAARRLNQELGESGIDSKFAALSQPDFIPTINEFSINRSLSKRIGSVINAQIASRLSEKIFFSLFSVNNIDVKKTDILGDPNKTILHLHNWFNLVNMRRLSELMEMGFNIAITLHDERLLTGGCHYTFDCKKFQTDCGICPELALPLSRIPKRNLYNFSQINQSHFHKVKFIAPSKWLLNQTKLSSTLNDKDVVFIPNLLPKAFQSNILASNKRAKAKFNIGVASMNNNSYVKGGDVLNELETLLQNSNYPVEILKLSEMNLLNNGMSYFWEQIDCLLVLSRADNSPNVIHEAKQLGIPIIATDVGGILELLDDDFDLILKSQDFNAHSILQKILVFKNRFFSLDNQLIMKSKFKQYLGNNLKQHVEIYESFFSND